jgi:hypothetical protein
MQTKFTTSTNIIRDSSRNISYIPTPNSFKVVNQVSNDFKRGLRSFNIIGSYGTGKSSFLWALQQSVLGKKKIFDFNILTHPKAEVINFIGEYKSITSVFADYFDVNLNKHSNETIFAEIFNRYHELGKKNPLLIIVVDEFGKFLEYAADNTPEKELYFIQQLSEFANNPDHNIILITTVHQNFDAYAFKLNNSQKQEWSKVKGRFREITFNEPVEQLLYLASEHLKKPRKIEHNVESNIKSALSLFKKSKAYTINAGYAGEVALKLFPLDLMAANILTLSLQRYGQNERSLFSFLESTDQTGINNFDYKKNQFYSISSVYDYLMFNFYSFLNSRYNPDFTLWASIKGALETVERVFDGNTVEYSKVIKAIGLLNITASQGADLGLEFLTKYCAVCLGIQNSSKIISDLEAKRIIHFRKFTNRFVLSEGTDLDIASALIEAGNKVSEIVNVPYLLNKYYQLPPVIAKAYSYLNGTPRLFEFKISDRPIAEVPKDEVDGFINLIFNEQLDIDIVQNASSEQGEAILYGYYRNSKTIKTLLFEIEKTKRVIDENSDDKAAIRELQHILLHQKNLLSHYILHNLYSSNKELKWFYGGEEITIKSKREFNKKLSEICDQVYSKTPKFKNELVNKHKISNSIHVAKKNYFRALVDNYNQPDLGFEKDKFPPEKTIYLTLLKENGIRLYSDEINFVTQVSKRSSFLPVWNYSNEFLNSAKLNRKSLLEFIEPLKKRPFKLKQGVIDFWIASFLFIKRDDFALFGSSGFIPYINDEVLELLVKYPEDYEIKTFDIEGVKLDIFNSYRIFLNQQSKEKISNQTFIETIKPFLTFYKGLSEYSRNTDRLKKETLLIRNAIANAKDPEKAFFEDFPTALGYNIDTIQKSKTSLKTYIEKLHDAIRELRTSYDALLARFEEFLLDEYVGKQMTFEEYKPMLQSRFKNLKKHLCLPHQKTFLQRLDSQLDDKKSWLSSLAQAVIGKSLEVIKDDEEVLLYDKFKTFIRELDSLTNLSKEDLDTEKEEVLGIELSSFVDGINRSLIRMPKHKLVEVTKIENTIKSKLTKDKSMNIAAVANILKELLLK